jgi:peptide/nickel transport system substrate-binding protein
MAADSKGGKRRQLRRLIRRGSQDAVELGQQADQQIEKLLLRRFDRLLSVKRFVLLWVLLFVVLTVTGVMQTRALSGYYQTLQPAAGGIYAEGVVGTFTNANPIYSSGKVDRAVSRIIFSSLMKYDRNNQLIGDLAESWSQGPAPTHYSFKLRHGVTWHDGEPFTADDVVFTYSTIKNPDAQSPLYTSWKDIKVSKQDSYTVNFDLPTAISSFPYALTNGIVPNHLLKTIAPLQMRSASFNTNPVGTGPFTWKYIELKGTPGIDLQQSLSFSTNQKYFGGKAKLDGYSLIAYIDEKRALDGFNKKQINALAGLETVPANLQKDTSVKQYDTPLTTAVMAFFNNSKPTLSNVEVRRALISAVDRGQFRTVSGAPVNMVDSPLLHGQLGYDGGIVEANFDQLHANQLLDAAGWRLGSDAIRAKDGQPLKLTMRSQNTPQYTAVAQNLQKQWQAVGVKIDVQYYDAGDLQGGVIGGHDYDILLYGINIGVDPDVFAYWDSSQASVSSAGHLNLSEYKSSAADAALEGARTRTDPSLRLVKLRPFLNAWVTDAPALALYQPNFLYISRGPVFNYERKSMNTPTDRYFNVNEWMIRQSRQSQ